MMMTTRNNIIPTSPIQLKIIVLQHQLQIIQQRQQQLQTSFVRGGILISVGVWGTITIITATFIQQMILMQRKRRRRRRQITTTTTTTTTMDQSQQQQNPQNKNSNNSSTVRWYHQLYHRYYFSCSSFWQRFICGCQPTSSTLVKHRIHNDDERNMHRNDENTPKASNNTNTSEQSLLPIDLTSVSSWNPTTNKKQNHSVENYTTIPTGIVTTTTETSAAAAAAAATTTIMTNNNEATKQRNNHNNNNHHNHNQPYPTTKYKYLEILVHNVSHTDLVLGLDLPPHHHSVDNKIDIKSQQFDSKNTATVTTTTMKKKSRCRGTQSSSIDNHTTGTTRNDRNEGCDIDNDNDDDVDDDDDDNDMIHNSTSPYMKNYIRPRFSSFDLFCRLVLDQVVHTTNNHHHHHPHHTLTTTTTTAASTTTTTGSTVDSTTSITTNTNDNTDASAEKNGDPIAAPDASTAASTTLATPIQTPETTTTIIHFPRYQRSMIDPRYSIRQYQENFTTKKKYVPPKMAPTGIQLSYPVPLPVVTSSSILQSHPIEDTIRIRGRDAATILSAIKNDSTHHKQSKASNIDNGVSIKYVFFPLLATLLPVWYRQIKEKEYQEAVKRVLILVTGVGTPRNYTHSIHGNSTEACADLMKVFVSNIDPSLSVVKVFSDTTNIFRTDENILFCERELIPLINAYRNAHVMGTPYPDDDDYVPILDETSVYFDDDAEADWRTRLHVTLSFADGSPARTQAIQSSLRSYKPTYFHFWQLKTFWHESKIVDDDIEVHSFATMESIPAIDTSQIRDPYVQAIVSEMRAFYDEMITALNNKDNDIDRFWLRKSHKPVLAVLLVQPSSSVTPSNNMDGTTLQSPKFSLYRGTNMEVSMPTGSLCAERNAIGSALAMNPNLKRHDLKMIAVLAVPPLEPTTITATNTVETFGRDRLKSAVDSVQTTGSNKFATLGDGKDRINDNIRRVTSYSSILEESLDPDDDDSDDHMVGGIHSQNTIDDHHSNDYYIRKLSIGSDYEPTTTTNATNNSTSADAETTTIIAATNSSFCLPAGSSVDGDGMVPDDTVSSSVVFKRKPTEPIRRIPLFPKVQQVTSTTTASLSDKWNRSKSTLPSSMATTTMINPISLKQRMKRTVIVQSQKDMNPLAPCGACNEWIKKIAQCNPYFKIITFTDANCNGMYISSCQD